MNEGSGNQDTSTEVLAEEEGLGRDLQLRELLGHYWEAGSCFTLDWSKLGFSIASGSRTANTGNNNKDWETLADPAFEKIGGTHKER